VTKREVVWLLVRLAGLYLLVQAFHESVALAAGLYTVLNSGSDLANDYAGLFFVGFLRLAFLGGLGLHLMRDGKGLFRLLSNESD
jgi:hypothetical protein